MSAPADDVIRALQGATEGGRAYDEAVAWVAAPLGDRQVFDGQRCLVVAIGPDGPWFSPLRHHPRIPPYTTSLDAALTLVPADASRSLNDWPQDKRAVATLGDTPLFRGIAATLPLALCIAALRARSVGQ